MRYIGHASTVPSLSLERVKGLIPPANNSPFTHLDSIYSFILSQVDDLEAMRTILSMQILLIESDCNLPSIVSVFDILHDYDHCYTKAVIKSCISELAALVQLAKYNHLEFYHASMTDFLLDQSRSGIYWIDINAFRVKALMAFWTKCMSCLYEVLQHCFLTRPKLYGIPICKDYSSPNLKNQLRT